MGQALLVVERRAGIVHILRLLRQALMKRTFRLTFGRRAVSCRRVKLLKFGLKLFVDEEQSLHCANYVAATGGHNLIDNGVGTI
jgi:hypothetical protein